MGIRGGTAALDQQVVFRPDPVLTQPLLPVAAPGPDDRLKFLLRGIDLAHIGEAHNPHQTSITREVRERPWYLGTAVKQQADHLLGRVETDDVTAEGERRRFST